MTNFKSGSGDLDFGDGADDDEESGEDDRADPEQTPARPPGRAGDDERGRGGERPGRGGERDRGDGDGSASDEPAYPYFVRRNNVGDERDTRLEVHVRDAVAERESEFRAALAEHLDASEVAKTDAREFALLAAYEHPERVAELMREEGFGAVE